MPDVPGNVTTTATITVGGTVNGTLETFGDHDWYRITLTAGQSVTVFVDGTTLEDSYLRIRDSSGTVIYENDDINSGVNRDSRLSFTAASSGTYYIDVGAWDENYTGNYQVSVSTYTPPPIATTDQIANQLVEGYWGGDDHNFNVTQGGSITVNITGLTAAAQNLATQALALWTDIIGVQFVQVNFGGQITFDDNESGAFSDGSWSGGFISSSHVNVSTQWLADYGTGLNGYSFQTYIHEIGHALGLGHAGNYNGSASFPFDALFQNDSWATSIMSYFSQTENSYFAGQGFTETFIVTPMMADIVAMSTLYGLSTTTRTGNTTYGFNSNAGRAVYDASLNPNVAYTIFDSGGTDTLDYSGFATGQQINLNPETFSNVGAQVGNIAIGRGVIIENAIGGSGNDILIGNPAANILIGEAGNDLLIGSFGNDTLNGGLGDDQVDGGFGADTLYGGEGNDVLVGREDNDLLIGSEGNDLLIGNIGDDQIDGGLGADTLDGGEGNDVLVGRENDDLLLGSGGNDLLIGSDGNDQIDGATGADTLDGGEGNDVLVGREGDDFLMGGAGADYLVGSDGNDRIAGGGGADGLLGGLGSDRFVFEGAAGNDRIEDFQSGADRIDLSAYGITINQVAAATTNGNTILSVDTNGNGVADFTITLIGAGAPVAADYVF